MLTARCLGAAATLIGQPPVVGEILAGILLGPTLFDGAIANALFPADIRPILGALANVGVAVFMFIVGLELDRTVLRGKMRVAVTLSLSSVLLPFGLGVSLAFYLATPARGAGQDKLRAVHRRRLVGHRVPSVGSHPA